MAEACQTMSDLPCGSALPYPIQAGAFLMVDSYKASSLLAHSTLHCTFNYVMLVQNSTGPNWLETIDCFRTYLAGPVEPVYHTFRINA